MAALTQTIAIVDKSNKVVSTTKQLKNVFKEAKLAYLERKAEIVADRRAREDRELRKAIKAVQIAEDARSETSRGSRRHRSERREHEHEQHRPSASGHHHSSGSVRRASHAHGPPTAAYIPPAEAPSNNYVGLAQFNEELYGGPRSAPMTPVGPHEGYGLVRRTTDLSLDSHHHRRPAPMRSHSTSEMDDHIDMDLAYGEIHPDSLLLDPKVEGALQKQEMSSLITKCNILMDEANCAQHSVRAIIAHLQKNPDAMAAVALTLAEISNLATKMAPGVLAALKTGAPTVFAMLAAPEFLIAVGVGVGITIVMFGGYKIIKKIRARIGDKDDDGVDEMLTVNELDHIDHWRRGLPDAETASVATSVEGEFITPMAAVSMGHLPLRTERSEGNHREKNREGKSRRKQRQIEDDPERTLVPSEGSSKASRKSKSEKREKVVVKVKKPSPLRRIFNSKDSESSSRR